MSQFHWPDEGLLTAQAKEWAEGRKPAALVQELFTRLLQLTALVVHLAGLAGVTFPETANPAEADARDAERVQDERAKAGLPWQPPGKGE